MRRRSRPPVAACVLPAVLAIAGLACNTLLPPRPAIEWDPSPDAVVVEAHVGGGMLYEPNAVYWARLWGDGRLIWLTNAPSGGARQVSIAALTPEAMTALLQDFVNAGFFGWEDQYSPGIIYDAPNTCLRVWLTGAAHGVSRSSRATTPRCFSRP